MTAKVNYVFFLIFLFPRPRAFPIGRRVDPSHPFPRPALRSASPGENAVIVIIQRCDDARKGIYAVARRRLRDFLKLASPRHGERAFL